MHNPVSRSFHEPNSAGSLHQMAGVIRLSSSREGQRALPGMDKESPAGPAISLMTAISAAQVLRATELEGMQVNAVNETLWSSNV